jgi:hypothetical protein
MMLVAPKGSCPSYLSLAVVRRLTVQRRVQEADGPANLVVDRLQISTPMEKDLRSDSEDRGIFE